MNKIKILVEGYAKMLDEGWKASCTTTLIQTGKLNIVVDPGTNRESLQKALKAESLSFEKGVDIVLLTHSHTDHTLNAGLFINSKIVDEEAVYKGDYATEYDGKTIPGTDIAILQTPGHTATHFSPIVETEDLGTVVVAQDVFWWLDNEEQVVDLDKSDDFAEDMGALKESRKKVLEIADWIIPGHGKMFKNPTK